MDKTTTLAEAKYSHLTFNAPLSNVHADSLLTHLQLTSTTTLVDLGCGWGELLLRVAWRSCNTQPGTQTGVDTDAAALLRGREAAIRRKLRNVEFIEQPAADFQGARDRAICIGSSHALGGSRAMLKRLAEIVPRGGRALVGDMCWEREPTKAALASFGEEVLMLKDLVGMCRAEGWEVLHLSTADQREWDEFESGHRAGLREWFLANREHPKAAEVKMQHDEREMEYLGSW
ncbi:hypothetical protein N0V88_006341 [Collariella sp. IMI 366227]|nr:hypothetical protein N0V88_006341 [Collariella sp. IMI 366227]